MKPLDWDDAKNQWLKRERGISFEDVVTLIALGRVVEIVPHKNQEKYPGQRIIVLDVEGYIYLVPFDETEERILLRTIIPSRKATRDYYGDKKR